MIGIERSSQLLYYRMVSHPQAAAESTIESSPSSFAAFFVAWAVIICLAIIAVRGLEPPAPLPANAPENEFSASRAMAHVREIARTPHSLGTAADAAVRKYLLTELSALGVQATVFSEIGINASGSTVAAGHINDIVVLLPGKGPGPAILLMAHYDSV